MLLVHLIPYIVPETLRTRIPEIQEEGVMEHNYAQTINESQSAVPHLAKALEGRFVGNCDEQPQSDEVEQSRDPHFVSCSECVETHGVNFAHFLYRSGSCNSETMFRKDYVHFFSCTVVRAGSVTHFSITLKFHSLLPVSWAHILVYQILKQV